MSSTQLSEEQRTTKRKAPAGVDKLHELLQRIEILEAQAHTQHTFSLDASAIDQIAEVVVQKLLARLTAKPEG